MKKNNWYVITAGPCAGKTTVLRELEKMGYPVIEEAARTFIDQELGRGKTMADIRGDELEFQRQLLHMKLDIEKELSPEKTIFFDRGIPDSDTYYQIAGSKNDPELQSALASCSYRKMFLFELLPMEEDYSRTDAHLAAKISQMLEKSYKKLDIPVVKVPVMSIQERVEFVLHHL